MVFANLIVQLSILSKLPFIPESRSAWFRDGSRLGSHTITAIYRGAGVYLYADVSHGTSQSA
jgi:hypothetical protein